MTRAEWDAIVVGASFGGLAAAVELAGAGRVLLIDKDDVGANQTSACATPLAVMERLELLDSLEQVHEELVVHVPRGAVQRFPLAYPYATFDYRRLCQLLAERTQATFLQARAQGIRDGRVRTSQGDFAAPVVIDASGWRCAVGGELRGRPPGHQDRSVGLEAALPRGGRGLHFWVGDERARDGYLWDFPAGHQSRVGLLRYRSGGGLKPRLASFTDGDSDGAPIHGGVLPSRFGEPVAGTVFLVGDAAGQCLPLSGEGIRPALVYGQLAGRLAAEVLRGGTSLEQALASYRQAALRARSKYHLLAALERALPHLPHRLLAATTWYFGAGPFSRACQDAYWRIAPAELLRPSAAVGIAGT